MNGNTKRRACFRALVTLAVPIIFEEILTTLLQYVDTAMVGRLGEDATASVSLTTSINWLIGCIFSAIGIAVTAMISTSYGARDTDKIKKVSSQVVLYVLAGGLTVGAVAVALSSVIPVWMRADENIRTLAGQYFRIISIPLVFRASAIICASALRAVKDSETPMFVDLSANLVNVGLNYLLIYRAGLGVRGAAIATAISTSIMGILMMVFMFARKELMCSLRNFRFEPGILKETARIGGPVMATNMTSCLGHIVFAALVSSMGTTVFAAHSLALNAETIFYVPGYALRGATSTMAGISVGENDREKFKIIERQSVLLTMVMMAISGIIMLCFSTRIISIFTPSAPVIEQGARVLRLIAVSEPIFGLMIVSEGIYYGLGETKYTFIVETIGSWAIRIVFSVICINVLHTGLFQVWICMFADNTFRALALAIPLYGSRDEKLFEKRLKSAGITA